MGVRPEQSLTLSPERAASQADAFRWEREHRSVMNAVRASGIRAVAMDQAVAAKTRHTFSLERATGLITNQKQSGRCWALAGFNLLDALKAFEFSQAHQMFWDKLEKANYFLSNVLATAEEPVDSEAVACLRVRGNGHGPVRLRGRAGGAAGHEQGEPPAVRGKPAHPRHAHHGVNLVEGWPSRWKVENSWRTDRGHHGWFVMSQNWFAEHTCHVIGRRRHLPAPQRAARASPAQVLPLWSPVGDSV